MPRKSPFKHHRFPRGIILCAVRWYLRYPLSYQDVVDLLAERDVTVDRSTISRWVQKFGPELTKRTEKHLRRASLDWHVDETYIRVGGTVGAQVVHALCTRCACRFGHKTLALTLDSRRMAERRSSAVARTLRSQAKDPWQNQPGDIAPPCP